MAGFLGFNGAQLQNGSSATSHKKIQIKCARVGRKKYGG